MLNESLKSKNTPEKPLENVTIVKQKTNVLAMLAHKQLDLSKNKPNSASQIILPQNISCPDKANMLYGFNMKNSLPVGSLINEI